MGEGLTREDPAVRLTARSTDPTAYLERSGNRVKQEGRHLSVSYCQAIRLSIMAS